jgi:hypothetical protein
MTSPPSAAGVRWGRLAIVVAIAGVALLLWLRIRSAKPDFATVGGTILLYEMEEQDPSVEIFDANEALIVETIERRLAGLDLPVTVRAAGPGQVEFLVARRENHADDVRRVKERFSRRGKLELAILANDKDDAEGQQAARQSVRQAKDGDERARKGQPPRGPVNSAGAGPMLFAITLPRGHVSEVSYRWVELGRPMRQLLELDTEAGAARVPLDEPSKLADASGRFLLQGALFFARRCANENLTVEDRRAKKTDIFVLARDVEISGGDRSRPVPRLGGHQLTRADAASVRPQGAHEPKATAHHGIDFGFHEEGIRLLAELTGKNVPSGSEEGGDQVKRHLAFVLDNVVLAAPVINAAVRDGKGEIRGAFTQEEVRDLVAILRGGSLQIPLRPAPSAETTVAPAGNQP